jgi:hypothetical protein
MSKGPVLQQLMQRLAAIPSSFFVPFLESIYDESMEKKINLPAIISDLVFDLGGDVPSPDSLSDFMTESQAENENYLRLVTICSYLFNDEWFCNAGIDASKILAFIRSKRLYSLANIVDYREFVEDMERREELVRLCLDGIGLYPKGENASLAQDRLTTLDSIERKRIIEKSKIAQRRARELREAMARKRAQEAASKMSRE